MASSMVMKPSLVLSNTDARGADFEKFVAFTFEIYLGKLMNAVKINSVCLLAFVLQATACQPTVPRKSGSDAVATEAAPATGTSVELTIVGFNYTDKDFNEFYADETGGGNLSVSSASGGGGGSVCCALYTTGEPEPEINVRWQSDACTYNIWHDEDGTEFNDIFSIYKTAALKVASVSSNPKYLEIHIYQDGHAEAAITDELSSPRLVLDQNRRINLPFRKCPSGLVPAHKLR